MTVEGWVPNCESGVVVRTWPRAARDSLQLDLEEQCHGRQDPLGCLLLGLQVKGPDVGGTTDACFVHGTLIDVLGLHAVHRDGLDEDDGHGWRQLFQPRFGNDSDLGVPASSCRGGTSEGQGGPR